MPGSSVIKLCYSVAFVWMLPFTTVSWNSCLAIYSRNSHVTYPCTQHSFLIWNAVHHPHHLCKSSLNWVPELQSSFITSLWMPTGDIQFELHYSFTCWLIKNIHYNFMSVMQTATLVTISSTNPLICWSMQLKTYGKEVGGGGPITLFLHSLLLSILFLHRHQTVNHTFHTHFVTYLPLFLIACCVISRLALSNYLSFGRYHAEIPVAIWTSWQTG